MAFWIHHELESDALPLRYRPEDVFFNVLIVEHSGRQLLISQGKGRCSGAGAGRKQLCESEMTNFVNSKIVSMKGKLHLGY